VRTIDPMVASAPRYSARIPDLIRALDDRSESIAEIARRVCAAAEKSGLTRPSYVHLRRLIHEERRRQDDFRELSGEVAIDLVRGVRIDPYDIADRARNIRR
jgi:hypothetical protein